MLAKNGIDVSRLITLLQKHNITMFRIYENSDDELFPNRCEGVTNLVLMEYMSSGKPVIVSYSSDHCDVAADHNAILLR